MITNLLDRLMGAIIESKCSLFQRQISVSCFIKCESRYKECKLSTKMESLQWKKIGNLKRFSTGNEVTERIYSTKGCDETDAIC